MFYLNVRLTVRNEADVPAVKAALERMVPMVRQEPGCKRFEVYHSQDNPTLFFLVEHWETREHWVAHRQLEAIQTIYLPEVLSRADREGHACEVVGGL